MTKKREREKIMKNPSSPPIYLYRYIRISLIFYISTLKQHFFDNLSQL